MYSSIGEYDFYLHNSTLYFSQTEDRKGLLLGQCEQMVFFNNHYSLSRRSRRDRKRATARVYLLPAEGSLSSFAVDTLFTKKYCLTPKLTLMGQAAQAILINADKNMLGVAISCGRTFR